jgi:hypothetical protein
LRPGLRLRLGLLFELRPHIPLRLSLRRLMADAVRSAPGRLRLRGRAPVRFRAAVAGRAFLPFGAAGLCLGGPSFRGGVPMRRLLLLLVLVVFFRHDREAIPGRGALRKLVGGRALDRVWIGRRVGLNWDPQVGVSLLITRLPPMAPPLCGEEVPPHQRHVERQKHDDGYIKVQSITSCAHNT